MSNTEESDSDHDEKQALVTKVSSDTHNRTPYPFLGDIEALNKSTDATHTNTICKGEEKYNEQILHAKKIVEQSIDAIIQAQDPAPGLHQHIDLSMDTKFTKPTRKYGTNMCTKYGNLIYDIMAITISIADLVTDLYVLYEYYMLDRTVFFVLSCVVICLAQLAYCFAFTAQFSPYSDPISYKICTFISCIPFAPFLSFIIYFAADSESKFAAKFLQGICKLRVEKPYVDTKASKYKKWVQLKFAKHLGFILEAAVEAFPQSIIQMVAIVYYQEADAIAITSILISMLSVSSKSLIFSRSIDPLTFIWNWLCCVCDFFGIFFTIAWVFYNPHSDGTLSSADNTIFGGFSLIGKIWIFKILICVLPVVSYTGFGAALYWFCDVFHDAYDSAQYKHYEHVRQYRLTQWNLIHGQSIHVTDTQLKTIHYPCIWMLCFILKVFVYFILILTGICLMYCCGVIFVTLIAEIAAFTYIAALFYLITTDRFPHSCAVDHNLWLQIFKFVENAHDHKIYSPHDKLLRILCINRIIEKEGIPHDNGVKEYLETHEKDTIMPYAEATWQGLYGSVNSGHYLEQDTIIRTLCWAYMSLYNDEWKEFVHLKNHRNYYGTDINRWRVKLVLRGIFIVFLSILLFILIPLYGASRILNMLFPVIILVWLYAGDYWSDIDLFQYCMLGVYGLLLCIMMMIGVFVFKLHTSIWYIMPKHNLRRMKEQKKADDLLQRINEYYTECTAIKPREFAVYQTFGVDIGTVVLRYLPRFFEK